MSQSDDKTEPPTPKRLRDARKKGQVAKSKELTSAVLIVALLMYLATSGEQYIELFNELIDMPAWFAGEDFSVALDAATSKAINIALQMLAPVIGIALLGAVAAEVAQVGILFTGETVKPDLKKLNPGKAIKQMFSKKNAIEFLKSCLKIGLMGYLIYMVIANAIPNLLNVPYCGIPCIPPLLGDMFFDVVKYASFAFILVAAFDYGFQKSQHIKELKMSKDEIKREFKEQEGSPEIKGKRRQLFQEIVNSQQQSNVKRSTVIVSNPTHLAVGLYYEEQRTPLPVVTLQERGLQAERVFAIAEAEGIPVMQDIPLAHALMDANLHAYIPNDLVQPVVELLRLLRQLQQRGGPF